VKKENMQKTNPKKKKVETQEEYDFSSGVRGKYVERYRREQTSSFWIQTWPKCSPTQPPPQCNPHRRLTVFEDVTRCIAALCHPATYWMIGKTLHMDGGENIVG